MRLHAQCWRVNVGTMWTTKILVTLYLAVVAAGYSDGSNDGDAFCRIVTILLNPTLRDCQTLMKVKLYGISSFTIKFCLYDRIIWTLFVMATARKNWHKLYMTVVIHNILI